MSTKLPVHLFLTKEKNNINNKKTKKQTNNNNNNKKDEIAGARPNMNIKVAVYVMAYLH